MLLEVLGDAPAVREGVSDCEIVVLALRVLEGVTLGDSVPVTEAVEVLVGEGVGVELRVGVGIGLPDTEGKVAAASCACVARTKES